MNSLVAALENSDPKIIQAHLEDIDQAQNRIITLRTRVGAIYNSVLSTRNNIEKSKISDLEQRSQIADADVAELYSDIVRQQNVLQATYKSGQNIINKTLLDFL